MKRIDVPSDIVLVNPITKKPFLEHVTKEHPEGSPVTKSYRDYAGEVWLNDQRIAQTRAQVRRRKVIEETFDDATAGSVQYMEDADYAIVLPIVEERPPSYSPAIEQQLLAFDDAFLSAKDVKSKDANVASAKEEPLNDAPAAH